MDGQSDQHTPDSGAPGVVRIGGSGGPRGGPDQAPATPLGTAGRGADEPSISSTGPARLTFLPWQLAGALLIAGASDLIGGGIDATLAGVPATIPIDILTALALWAILGRPVLLLVALIAEALPGVGVLPLWTAVVIAIAMTGGIPGRVPR
jgi:hypothetical protein